MAHAHTTSQARFGAALVAAALLATSLASVVDASPATPGLSPVDLSIAQNAYIDPPVFGNVASAQIAVRNDGGTTASDVVATFAIPAGAALANIETGQGSVASSTSDAGEEVTAEIGTLAPGASVLIYLQARFTTAAPTSSVEIVGTVRSAGEDADDFDNELVLSFTVPVAPIIDGAVAADTPGGAFKLKITGRRFRNGFAGVFVQIGDGPVTSDGVHLLSSTKIVVRGGDELRAQFPAGVPVRVRVYNGTGGLAETLVTR
jgi:hypothetical protein